MANYTQFNIYRKQMQELGLNTKQYAELINMPYEVVKDIIYDKEGEYSMDIKNILRRNMIDKHQEIENDYDNAKFKAMEIKNEVDYLDWYNNEYSIDLLKDKLHVRTLIEFKREYNLMVNGKKASDWIYSVLTSKREYPGHEIEKSKKIQFVKQLYDLLVNDNKEEYTKRKTIKVKNEKINYEKWYKDFNVKQFMSKNHLSNTMLEEALNYSPAVISRLVNKRKHSKNSLIALYDYVQKFENDYQNIASKYIDEQDDNNATSKLTTASTTNEPFNITMKAPEVSIVNEQEELLRKILINRLTEEEKMLIELFGGKIC